MQATQGHSMTPIILVWSCWNYAVECCICCVGCCSPCCVACCVACSTRNCAAGSCSPSGRWCQFAAKHRGSVCPGEGLCLPCKSNPNAALAGLRTVEQGTGWYLRTGLTQNPVTNGGVANWHLCRRHVRTLVVAAGRACGGWAVMRGGCVFGLYHLYHVEAGLGTACRECWGSVAFVWTSVDCFSTATCEPWRGGVGQSCLATTCLTPCWWLYQCSSSVLGCCCPR